MVLYGWVACHVFVYGLSNFCDLILRFKTDISKKDLTVLYRRRLKQLGFDHNNVTWLGRNTLIFLLAPFTAICPVIRTAKPMFHRRWRGPVRHLAHELAPHATTKAQAQALRNVADG